MHYPPSNLLRRFPKRGSAIYSTFFLSAPADQVLEIGESSKASAFTLVELLAVVAIMITMIALAVPAFNAMRGAGDVTKAAYDISGAIESARSYAIANSTYTWIGFYEEDAGALLATNTKPPYTGKGRVVVAVVYSKDGTTNCQDSNATSTNPIPLTPSLIGQLGRIAKIEKVHMTDVGAPTGGSNVTLDGRPDLPYTYGSANSVDYQNRINSDDTHSTNATKYPFTVQGYTFWKTIRFNPRGEASINSTYSLRPLTEIGLRPTHGNAPDLATKNVAVIQLTGISGNTKIYRR
ncbi:MAG: hypothetical protein ABIT76_09675 [Chthoniobacterales bacterium]